MAAKVFQIIGTVFVILFTVVLIVILPVLARLLKRLNKSFGKRRTDLSGQMRTSISSIEGAQGQIEAIGAMTGAVKAGMASAIALADRVVVFLRSSTFQVGLPLVMWFLLLALAVPRGLLGIKKRRKSRREPIPPPSWQLAEAEGEAAS